MTRMPSQSEAASTEAVSSPGEPEAAAVEIAEALPTRFARWMRRATLTGLGISLIVHLVAMLIAGLWVFQRVDGQLGGGTLGEVDFAVMSDSELRELQSSSSLASSDPEVPELEVRERDAVELLATRTDALSGLSLDSSELSLDLGAGAGAADFDAAGGIGGSGSASFFGVEAVGRRFAFVADRSGSMIIAGRWDILKDQLHESIQGMSENASFFVVLFSSDAMPMGGRTGWTEASRTGKGWARREVSALPGPSGGTIPVPGFEYVFRLRPLPDAIYFLTDGEFAEEQASEIIRMNGTHRIPIHCITLASDEGRANMERIARATNGTYTHVPGRGP